MLGKKRQKVIKTAVLGSTMQTVQILLQNFRFYAINTLYCIKKYIFCAIGCKNKVFFKYNEEIGLNTWKRLLPILRLFNNIVSKWKIDLFHFHFKHYPRIRSSGIDKQSISRFKIYMLYPINTIVVFEEIYQPKMLGV